MHRTWGLGALVMTTLSLAATAAQELRIKEYLGRTWSDELVSFPLDRSLAKAAGVSVTDAAGKPQPCQVADGRVYLLVTLPANGELVFSVAKGASAVKPEHDATVSEADGMVTLDAGALAMRLPAGQKQFAAPVVADTVPGPLQGVRGAQGAWLGKSWLQAPLKVTGMATIVTATGPLFAEARVEYTFEGGKHYRFTARVIAGQPLAIIDETMDLNPDGKFALLKYANDADASTWEWWNLADSEHLGVGTTGHQQPANVIFSFYTGLEPNACRWIAGRANHPSKGVDAQGKIAMSVEAAEAYAPLTYGADEQFNRLTGWWLNSFSNRSHAFTMYNDAKPDNPAVSLIMGRPSRNINPNMVPPPEPWVKITSGLNDMRILTRQAKDIQVWGPICLGSREWMLSVAPQSAFPAKGAPAMPYTYHAMLKYSYFPLDKIKDWSFDWPEPKNTWPRLFCQAGDLATMQARVKAASGAMAQTAGIPAIYRANGTPEAMAKQALTLLEGQVRGALDGNSHGGINWFHASLGMIAAMPLWEAAMATPGLDPAVRAKLKACGAFVAHRAWDDDYWPSKEAGNGWGSINMGTLAGTARVLTAAAMAGHPRHDAWLKRSRGYLDGNLGPLQFPDGSNVSCPHYMGAAMEPILFMALAMKYGGGYDAFREDPRLRKAGQFMIDILTPPDPRSPLVGGGQAGLPLGAKLNPAARNRRNIWPLGHTSRTETTGIIDLLALGYAGIDEPLAGALRTMSAEMGGTSGGAFVPTALLSNVTSPPAAPDLRSRWYPYYGAILRDNQPAETWFAIRYSKHAADHFQADMGAFTLFAHGVPLMMDFGSMYSPENGQAVYHNRIAWNVREGEPKPCPGNQKPGCFYEGMTYFEHKVEPWTDQVETYGQGQGPIDAFGEIKTFASLPAADFLLGHTDVRNLQTEPYFPDTSAATAPDPNQKRQTAPVTPFAWQRRVLFAKAQPGSAASFLLVRDDFVGNCPAPTASFWVMAEELTFAGNRAHAKGQFGVDLELVALQPAQPAFTKWQWEHKNWGGERQLCVRIPQTSGKPNLVLLYPHARDAILPEFTTIAGGNGVKAKHADGAAEFAFLAPSAVEFDGDGVRFQGTAGTVTVQGDAATVALPQPGTVTATGVTLACTGAASLRAGDKRLTVATDGAAQTVTLSGKLPAKPALTLDGKKLRAKLDAGILTLAVPEGRHEIVVQ